MSSSERNAVTRPVRDLASQWKGREVRLVRLDAGEVRTIIDLFRGRKETVTLTLEVSPVGGFDGGAGGDPATVVAVAMVDTGPEGEA
jgi:hypothetical protein